MNEALRVALMAYLEYLLHLPETRLNKSLIDCTIKILQEAPDTEG